MSSGFCPPSELLELRRRKEHPAGAVLENFQEGAPKEGFSDPVLVSLSPEGVPSSVSCWQPQHYRSGSVGNLPAPLPVLALSWSLGATLL